MDSPVLWNLNRAWEHLAAAFKLVNDDPEASKVFMRELEKVMIAFSGVKGLYLDVQADKKGD